MKFARFFIDRPIFAAVLSLLITVAGALALIKLPISEYPSVIPPTVVVSGTYPGANPKVIAETVAAPLEQQAERARKYALHVFAVHADGRMTLTVTFALGTNLDTPRYRFRTASAQALPRLPQEVQRIGVTTEKASPDIMMAAHLVSPDNRYDMLYLSNLAYLKVKDELAQIPASATCRSSAPASTACASGSTRQAGRARADRHRRRPRHSRAERAGGRRRARRPAAPSDTTFQLLINAQGRLTTEEQFATSSCAATPTGRSRGVATSAASSSAPTSTRCAACSTTSRP
jgi:multidrug efflux pump